MKYLSDDLRQQVEQLLQDGHSDLAVHQQTGVARTTVARYRKRLGLPGYRTTADSPTCRHGHAYPENAFRGSDGYLRCRACAAKRSSDRYAPDEATITRAAAGDPPERVTPRERHAAIAQLDRWNLSSAVIAKRVGCSRRTVHRARNKGVAA